MLPCGTKYLKLNANVTFRTVALTYICYAEVNCGRTQKLD